MLSFYLNCSIKPVQVFCVASCCISCQLWFSHTCSPCAYFCRIKQTCRNWSNIKVTSITRRSQATLPECNAFMSAL